MHQERNALLTDRLPPQNIDAEESFLAMCLFDFDAEAVELLSQDDFYRSSHQKIFSAISEIHASGKTINLISLKDHLQNKHQLEECGGASYLAQLVNEIPVSTNVHQTADIIKNASIKRRIIKLCGETIQGCFDGEDINNVLGNLQDAAGKIDICSGSDSWVQIGSLSEELIEHWETAKERLGITGVPCGLIDIDNALGGFQPTDLIVIAGRPGMGKTAFALGCAKNAGLKGYPVGIFSIEMASKQLITRTVSDITGIDGERFRVGRLESGHWAIITEALSVLQNAPIYIDDSPTAHIRTIQRKIRRFVKRYSNGKTPLIIIDYLQYIEGIKSERTDIEIGTITRGLKAVAKELEIPIILLSQLSRKVEDRTDKRPMASDLRGSGTIEQDADIIAFLYRDEFYNKDENNPNIGKAEFIINKYRNGKVGSILLRWDGHKTSFSSITNENMY